jgi:uncharacterized membrane protein
MCLMAVDHASMFFDRRHVTSDGAEAWVRGTALPTDEFLSRWLTHLCAPTFLFLAGTSLALSFQRRRGTGAEAAFDRDLLVRGALLIALDVVLVSTITGHLVLQVLYAIGLSMIAMVPLRRLGTGTLLALSVGWFVLGEALTGLVWRGQGHAAVLSALLVTTHDGEPVWIFYPVIPWLAFMVLGWVFGHDLLRREQRGQGAPVRLLALVGVGLLALFVVVRAARGYGNMFLPAEDASLVQWLHVSKYPPSLAFAALELGLMALLLALFMRLEARGPANRNGPLLVFGQAALFFYVVHFTALRALASLTHWRGGLGLTWVLAALLLVALYVPCRWWRAYKQDRPGSWARFV